MVELGLLPRPNRKRKGRSFWFGLLSLGLLTAIWGYSNVIIRQLEFSLNPTSLLLVRYLAVALIGLPILLKGPRVSLYHTLLGLAAGVFLSATTLSQAIAMQTVSVDTVSFITTLYVVLTPFLMALWKRKLPHRIVWVGTLLSLIGVLCLVGRVTLSAHDGIFWAVGSAFMATLQIIATARASHFIGTMQLTVLEAMGATIALLVFIIFSGGLNAHTFMAFSHSNPATLWRLLYLALFGTLIAGWLQVWGQRQVSETEAALIFNMEPVWTVIFALWVFHQWLSWRQALGALFIIASLVLLSLRGEEAADLQIPPGEAPYREH